MSVMGSAGGGRDVDASVVTKAPSSGGGVLMMGGGCWMGGRGPMDKLSFLLRFAENLKLPYEIHVFERSLGPPG